MNPAMSTAKNPPSPPDYDVEGDGDGEETIAVPALVTRQLPEGMKVFTVAFEEKPTRPFALVFQNETSGQEEIHQFEAVGDAGAGGMLAVSSLIRYDSKNRQLVDLNAMLVFFERVLVEGDYDRFVEVVRDRPDLVISMEQLSEVFNWLMEEYTGRPTQPSSDSASSRQSGGRFSKAKRR